MTAPTAETTDETSTATSPGSTTSGAPTTGAPTGATSVEPTTSGTSNPDGNNFLCAELDEHQVRCSYDLWQPHECDPWAQDCPTGDKCNPYSHDGDHQWESLKCFPLDPNPDQVGEPCTVEGGPASGVDSCAIGAMCWGVDLMTLEGTCVGFCTGSPDAPMCPQGTTCLITNDNVLILCLPTCDPLVQDCPDGDLCVINPDDPDAFMCVLDSSGVEGQLFDPCEYLNACDPGLTCQEPELASECDPMALGCCLPFCDTTAPNTCPGAMQQCLPWFGMEMPPLAYENVGLCGLPQ